MKIVLFALLVTIKSVDSFASLGQRLANQSTIRSYLRATTDDDDHETKSTSKSSSRVTEEVDVVVVGSGIGGLSCGALTSKYGFKTVCVEAHDTPGGVAHSFSRYSSTSKTVPFRFDSGPSLITGLSSKSTNPLRQVLDAIGTADDIEWKKYDGWIVHDYADGKPLRLTTGDGGT